LWSFAVLILIVTAASSIFDPVEVWRRLEDKRP